MNDNVALNRLDVEKLQPFVIATTISDMSVLFFGLFLRFLRGIGIVTAGLKFDYCRTFVVVFYCTFSPRLFCRAADRAAHTVPSYEEVVGSGDYLVRQSNLRSSTSQLPSYEDIIAAVENEGRELTDNPSEITPLNDPTLAQTEPAAEIQTDPPGLKSNQSLLTRSASRASRLLRPLRLRRVKSDKLHLKDFRIQIRSPTQNPVTIEPITPPPQYDNKMPELG